MAAGRLSAAAGIWRWTDEPVLSPELSALLKQQMDENGKYYVDAVITAAKVMGQEGNVTELHEAPEKKA